MLGALTHIELQKFRVWEAVAPSPSRAAWSQGISQLCQSESVNLELSRTLGSPLKNHVHIYIYTHRNICTYVYAYIWNRVEWFIINRYTDFENSEIASPVLNAEFTILNL